MKLHEVFCLTIKKYVLVSVSALFTLSIYEEISTR
jgi:hypothetical protein